MVIFSKTHKKYVFTGQLLKSQILKVSTLLFKYKIQTES